MSWIVWLPGSEVQGCSLCPSGAPSAKSSSGCYSCGQRPRRKSGVTRSCTCHSAEEAHSMRRYTRIMSKSTEDRITTSPEVCGGKACIAGHRVRVLDVVVWHEHQGMTPDEIVSHFPTSTLADVHAALAYYFDHVEEIQQEMRAERAFAEEFRRNNPSVLEAKLRQERLEEAS